MHHFFLRPDRCDETLLTLTGREAHHASHVLRLRQGDQVIVLDGAGSEYLCEATQLTGGTVRLAVIRKRTIPALPYRITLLQGIPKGKLMDGIIQKATELGVYRVVPVLSERVVTQLAEEQAGRKTEHWRTVATEACKQCGSAWLPAIEAPTTPQEFTARREKFDLPLIASLQADARHPGEWFRLFRAEHGHLPQTLCVWIGPEGDFSPAEIETVKSAGARPITLGRLVLRSETAATYCLSVLNYEMQAS